MSETADSSFNNWIKGCVGLKYLKQGLFGSIDRLMQKHHKDLIDKFEADKQIPAVNCTECTLQNILPDHKRKDCFLKFKQKCFCNSTNTRRPCPNKFCSYFYDLISLFHDERNPNWFNTDPGEWYSNHWSLAQCAVATSGYADKRSAVETDAAGLLSIVLNNNDLLDSIDCKDTFLKAKDVRNEIMHTTDFQVTDEKLNYFIDRMVAVLKDKQLLENDIDAQVAVAELEKLRKEKLSIQSQALNEVLDETIEKMKDSKEDFILLKRQELKSLRRSVASQRISTLHTINQAEIKAVKHVQKKTKRYATQLTEKMSNFESRVDTVIKQHEQDIHDQSEEYITKSKQHLKLLETDVSSHKDTIRKVLADSINDLEEIFEQHQKKLDDTVDEKAKRFDQNIHNACDILDKVKEYERKMEERVKTTTQGDSNSTRCTSIGHMVTTKLDNYSLLKQDFQIQLKNTYERQVVKESPFPLIQERNQEDVSQIYVTPWFTEAKKFMEGKEEDKHVNILDVFQVKGSSLRNIFIVGETGCGKSTFFKFMVHQWCLNVVKQGSGSDELKHDMEDTLKIFQSDLLKILGSFEFLFYIPLSRCIDCCNVKMMLNKLYPNVVLTTILAKESAKCLILLDELDNWKPKTKDWCDFQSRGLPEQDLDTEYTVITTCSPWTLEVLRVKDSDMDVAVKLKGIQKGSINIFIEKMMATLNKDFGKDRVAAHFESELSACSVADKSYVPLILKQLICIWYDQNPIHESIMCTSLLELYFEWSDGRKSRNSQDGNSQTAFSLPEFFSSYSGCMKNEYMIWNLSQLAYQMLFGKKKLMLSFSTSTIGKLKIPYEIVVNAIEIGILSADRDVPFLASRRQQLTFSFIHKSIVKYLAALNISCQFNQSILPSSAVYHRCYSCKYPLLKFTFCNLCIDEKSENSKDSCKRCALKFLETYKTIDDIIEHSSLFIVLCGFEPRLATDISEHIHNAASVDKRAVKYRTSLCRDSYGFVDDRLPLDVQRCILKCTEEVCLQDSSDRTEIFIGDIIIDSDKAMEEIVLYIEKQVYLPDTVRSLKITHSHLDTRSLQCLNKCSQLKAIRYDICSTEDKAFDERNETKIVEILERNTATLVCVDMESTNDLIIRQIIRKLPSMSLLSALSLSLVSENVNLSHEDCCSLKNILEDMIHIKQISVHINCEQNDVHRVDLSGHKNLHYVKFVSGNFYVQKLNCENLVSCMLRNSSSDAAGHTVCALHKAFRLKHFELHSSRSESASRSEDMTMELARLVSLPSLKKIILWDFKLTENIFPHSSDMRNLKQVDLENIEMSMTTWCKFIDSLALFPHGVNVNIHRLYVSRADESDSTTDDQRYLDARRYVTEKTNFSNVTYDDQVELHFVTNKTDT